VKKVQKLSPSKKGLLALMKKTPVQQWYGDAFDFDYGGMAGASSSHPPFFDSPPSANSQNVEESIDEDNDDV
jgi:hypothetical protein